MGGGEEAKREKKRKRKRKREERGVIWQQVRGRLRERGWLIANRKREKREKEREKCVDNIRMAICHILVGPFQIENPLITI